MKAFEDLTHRGRVRRLRRLAQAALEQYGLGGARLAFIDYSENAVFCNVLFHRRWAQPIDFDDCGFGYWVYDLAVPLAHWQTNPQWLAYR